MHNFCLNCVRDAVKEKRRGKLSLGVWLLHDNVPVHKSLVAQVAVRDCGFGQLNYPAFNPDLAPSDYFLFRNLKSHFRGTRFTDDESLKASCCWSVVWRPGQISFFSRHKHLSRKVAKCIDVAVDYIKKMTICLKVCGYFLYRSCKIFEQPRNCFILYRCLDKVR